MTHKLTRLVALMLAVVMTFSMLLVPAEASSFRDVADGSWYAAAVEYVNERGWMAGVSETSFAPNAEVTRGMMVTVLARLADAETDNDTAAFADTAAGRWYTGAAAWAAEQGIVAGVGGGKFAPNRAITRQDLCTMLYAYIEAMGIELDDTIDRSFMDSNSVADYARTGVNYCAGTGLISGFNDGSFGARKTANRAQLAQILMRLDLLIQEKEKPEEPKPAQSFEEEADNGMTVAVEAPEGAFPENTDMTLIPVEDEAVLASIRYQTRLNNILACTDISFAKNGAELEPDTAVDVEISLADLDQVQNPAVVHMKDDGYVEFISSEIVSQNRGGGRALRFKATDFSVYAILEDNVADARLLVQFKEPVYTSTGYTLKDGYQVYITRQDVLNDEGVGEDEEDGHNYLNEIIADPTVPQSSGAQQFFGWSFHEDYTSAEADGQHTIQYVRDELTKLLKNEANDAAAVPYTIEEGESVITVYPIIYFFYTVCYKDELGDAVLDTEPIYSESAQMTVTVDHDYEPYIAGYEHVGWIRADDETVVLQNGATTQISANLVVRAKTAKGVWIAFKENTILPDYKGAKYVAPVFCQDNVVPVYSNHEKDSSLAGYEFDGWYKEYNPEAANEEDKWVDKFDFSQTNTLTEDEIEHGLTLKARFIPYTTADVTVIVWQQSVNDSYDVTEKTYEYLVSEKLHDKTVGDETTSISLSAYLGHDGKSSVTIAGKACSFKGFHYNTTTYSTTEIKPDGSTIINVYYDRDKCVVNFYTKQTITSSTVLRNIGSISDDEGSSLDQVYYYFPSTSKANVITYAGYSGDSYSGYTDYFYTYSPDAGTNHSTTHYTIIDNVMYTLRYDNASSTWQYKKDNTWISVSTYDILLVRDDDLHTYSSSNSYGQAKFWKSYEGLYEQKYSKYGYVFPTYNNSNENCRWHYSFFYSRTFASAVMVFDGNYNFYGLPQAFDTTAYHYLENIEGTGYLTPIEDPGNDEDGWRYEPWQGFTGNEYRAKTSARTTYYIAKKVNGSWTFTQKTTGSDGYTEWVPAGSYIWPTNSETYSIYTQPRMLMYDQGLEIHYAREKYAMSFFYGSFLDENEKAVSEAQYEGHEFEQITGIPYEKKLTEFANKTVESPVEGYVFTGWFKDQECSKAFDFNDEMTVGGKRAYARFTKIAYRVFLFANVNTAENGCQWPTDGSDNPIVTWASSDQNKNFKIGWNKLVNDGEEIRGARSGYALVGWYLDPECTKPFNFAVSLTEENVPELDDEEYDKTVDYTDYINGVYSNSDADRLFVTKKLNLYAKWRKVLEGASGIHVKYDADNAHVENHDPKYHGSFGTDNDNNVVTTWVDGTLYGDGANVIARSASIPGTAKYQFAYWEILDDVGNPTGKIVYPGQSFELDFNYVDVSTESGSTHTHKLYHVAAKAPNCGYEGNTEYYQCTECGVCFSDAAGTNKISKASTVLAVTGEHVPGDTWKKSASGHYQKCTVCGKSINQAAHDENDVRPITEPTATEAGVTAYYCSVCGYHVRDEEVPATGKHKVTFVAPNGFTAPEAQYVEVGSSINLSSIRPTGTVTGYTFYGWSLDQVDNADTAPTVYTSYTPDSNVTFYAVYSTTNYALLTSAPSSWAGKYVITNGTDTSMYVLKDATVTSNPTNIENSSNCSTYAASGIQMTGTSIYNVSNSYIFTMTATGSYYTLRSNSGTYYGDTGSSSDSYLAGYTSYNSNYCRWTPSMSNGKVKLKNYTTSLKFPCFGFSTENNYFWADYDNDSKFLLYFWKEATAYTTTIGSSGNSVSAPASAAGSQTPTRGVASGNIVTADGDVWYPTDKIVAGRDYLIGYVDDSGNTYLLMNYNPNPYQSSYSSYYRYYPYNSNYYGYGIQAETDADGNVTGVKTTSYANATLANATWRFEENGGYYKIQSQYQTGYYLRVYNTTSYSDCYPASGTSYATNWLWDEEDQVLSYYYSSSVTKYLTYISSAGDYSNLFHAPASVSGSSTIQLFSKTPKYTVTFVDQLDPQGDPIKVEDNIDPGTAVTAPEAPIHESYKFIGWYVGDAVANLDEVNSSMTVTAKYEAAGPFTVTFMNEGFVFTTITNVTCQTTVQKPSNDPVHPTNATKYEFKEWELNGETFDFSTRITSDITLVAVYTVKESISYTFTLRAVYEPMKDFKYTHVTWYADNPDSYHKDSESVILNSGIAILDPTTLQEFENSGYIFAGWARMDEQTDETHAMQDGENTFGGYTVTIEDGVVIKYSELPEGEIWLRYMPADSGHQNPYFQVNIGQNGVENWQTVTHIAANENTPYHGLYAVWKARDTFYVVHSATGKMEAVKMAGYADGSKEGSTGNTFDLVSKVTSGYLYGGYYKAYGGADTLDMKDLAKTYETKSIVGWQEPTSASYYERSYDLTAENSAVNFESYEGKSAMTSDGKNRFFTRDNAYNPTLHANECKGDALKPVAGEIYYIKEVPSFYLQNKIVYSMNYHDNMKIIDVYQLTVVDDALYNYIGFDVDGEQQTGITYARSFTIDSLNWNDPITVTPHSIYNEIPEGMGYLCIKQLTIDEQFMDTHFVDDHIGSAYNVTPKWSTIDGIGQTNHAGTYIIANDDLSISYMEIVGRTFEEGEKIYVNMRPDSMSWWLNHSYQLELDNANTKFMAFLCIENTTGDTTTTASAWVELQPEEGNIFSISVPAGVWQKMVLLRVNVNCPEEKYWVRKEADCLYNQTGDIAIPMTGNYLTNFYQRTWKTENGQEMIDQSGDGGVWTTR